MHLAVVATMSFLAWGLPASAQASSAPAIESESVSGVTETYNEYNPPGHPRIDATLQAQINTEGLDTTYQFQIGTDTSYQLLIGCPGFASCEWLSEADGFPLTTTTIPGGSGDQAVSVTLSDFWAELSPSTVYHYRVVATNSAGTTEGPDQTFTTPPVGTAPSVDSVSVSNIAEDDATLQAQINPDGLQSTYQFTLGKECYPAVCEFIVEIPLPVEDLPGTAGEQSVTLDLNSIGVTLQPNSRYSYSVVATNAAGETSGDGGIFSTPAPVPVAPPNTTTSPAPQPTTGPPQNVGQSTTAPAVIEPAGSPKITVLTNAQKLAKALRACKRKPKTHRASCQKQARKKYGAKAKKR